MVIRRSNKLVYGNELVSPGGPWRDAPSTRAALDAERSRTWSSADRTAFRRAVSEVAAMRRDDPDFQDEMAAVGRLEPSFALASAFPAPPTPTRTPTRQVPPLPPPQTEHRRPRPGL